MKKWKYILLVVIVVAILYFLRGSEFTKNTSSYIYSLPFKKGTSHRVVQGYGGLFSHKHIAALDFSMPEGTPVLAAREGTVYAYKDDSNEGGISSSYEKKANYIIIQHSDGSYGCYWHLKHNGVVIKKGKVKEGQLIGYSGSTGMVLQPHLHFSVKTRLNYAMNSFIQTKFNTADGVAILKAGNSYESVTTEVE
ncbi:M23 family metallopeptidase [Ferruginibacter sp.]